MPLNQNMSGQHRWIRNLIDHNLFETLANHLLHELHLDRMVLLPCWWRRKPAFAGEQRSVKPLVLVPDTDEREILKRECLCFPPKLSPEIGRGQQAFYRFRKLRCIAGRDQKSRLAISN